MENEKQNKKNNIKKFFMEAFYWGGLGICLAWALICGAYQTTTTKVINDRLSNIEETLTNKEESALAREEVCRALPLNDSAVTNLAGSTWYFYEGLGLTAVPEFEYDIEFTSNNTNYSYLASELDGRVQRLYYNTTQVYYFYVSGGGGDLRTAPVRSDSNNWANDNYRTIAFTGGDDISNSGLISFMYDNAQLISYNPPEPEPEPEPEPVGIDYSLNNRYDFRKWFGEVDPLTGVVNMTTNNLNYFFDIGSVDIGGITYDHIAISFIQCTNAVNIITGYDFQNQCYLAVGGGDYYNSASSYYICLSVNLIVGDSYPTTNKLVLYSAPLVGARLQYESGNPISPTDYTPATGFLCSTFQLKETGINWTNYIPSETKYNFPGIGDNYSVYEVLQLDLINDTYLDFYSVSASATGGNVFDLISTAFKSLVPILGIQVIPGIPIGLLVVLPITATILIVVIKLVRK